jgi:hypothetical protein
MAIVHIITYAWDLNLKLYVIETENANKLSVFRRKQKQMYQLPPLQDDNGMEIERGRVEVLVFRRMTTIAMKLLIEFLRQATIPKDDRYYYNAYPDLLRFIKNKVTSDEYYATGMEKFYNFIVEQMFLSLTRPEDTDIRKVKKFLRRYKVPIPKQYEQYF